MPWKYQKSDGGATWWLGDVDVPLYRYAEALLIYAEAQNELGNVGAAQGALNQIRARARAGINGAESRAEPADYPAPWDTLGLREAIYMERVWELAFEAKRWFDLVRRDYMPGEAGYWQSSLTAHDPSSFAVQPIELHKRRFPIPDGQIRANPSLCQNAGYGGRPCPAGIQP
jgi:hypothetical protein